MRYRIWGTSERSKSSTWRNFAAIDLNFLWSLLRQFWKVRFSSGSLIARPSARVIEAGRMKLDLHRLAIKISQFCAEHSILLEVQWVPRTENEKADYISRLQVDFDDWKITQDFFLSL